MDVVTGLRLKGLDNRNTLLPGAVFEAVIRLLQEGKS